MVFGAWCLSKAMQMRGSTYAEFQDVQAGKRYAVQEVGVYGGCCSPEDECCHAHEVELQCQICTCEFKADMSKPPRCPNCESRDVEIV